MKRIPTAPRIDIAILDDDPDFRTYLEDFLNSEGPYRVRVFGRPDDLFQAAGETVPEIVLLDMKMGEFKGEVVLERLQALYPGICVIVITGYPSLDDMRTTFKLKVFDYLAKPFSLAQLRQTLHNSVQSFGLGRTSLEQLRERLGQRIKMLRVERGWSLKELAAASGVSISQLSSIERNANLPSLESLLAISDALDKRPSELFASCGF